MANKHERPVKPHTVDRREADAPSSTPYRVPRSRSIWTAPIAALTRAGSRNEHEG
jgi:hypothetical protein